MYVVGTPYPPSNVDRVLSVGTPYRPSNADRVVSVGPPYQPSNAVLSVGILTMRDILHDPDGVYGDGYNA